MSSITIRPLLRSNDSLPEDSDLRPSKRQKTVSSDDHLKEKEKLSKIVTKPKLNYGEWRDDCEGVREINSYALKNKILTDVTFVVGEKAEVFEAHRLILALSSPVFEAMFYGSLAEKGNSITIPDVEPEGFYYLLKFLYSERLFFTNYESAFRTAFAADKYCITNLKERCLVYLSKCELHPGNVWTFLDNSLYLNLSVIKYQSLAYVKRHIDCLENNSFLEASAKAVEEVLNLEENLVIEESKLLDAVLRWAEFRSSPGEVDSFKNLAMPLLRHVRFSLLRPSEFVNYLEVRRLKEILKDSDTLLILKHIVQPSLCALPDWCCSKLSRRRSKPDIGQDQNKAFTLRCRLFTRLPGNVRRMPARCLSSSSSSSLISSSSSSSSSEDSSSDS